MEKVHLCAMAASSDGIYYEVRCLVENIVIGESLDQQTAEQTASQHSLQTGHQTQVTPRPRG